MKLAFLYAGQGSQHGGMGKDMFEAYPEFAAVYENADPGFDLKEISFAKADERLNQTRYTQPCMAAFAAGMTEVLKGKGIKPDVTAGLSLGEYSALYAAGVFDAKTLIETTAFRGRVMEEAAEDVKSAMIAVLGLSREVLNTILSEVQAECGDEGKHLVIANYNCPGQLVIGGEASLAAEAAARAKAAGAKRCLPLKVSGPFHTPYMKSAGDALSVWFDTIEMKEPQIPVIFNCLGAEKQEAAAVKELLVKQVQSSVFMEDSIRYLKEMGVDTVIEIGPGKALSGFVKKTAPEITCYAAETAEDVEKLAELFGPETA